MAARFTEAKEFWNAVIGRLGSVKLAPPQQALALFDKIRWPWPKSPAPKPEKRAPFADQTAGGRIEPGELALRPYPTPPYYSDYAAAQPPYGRYEASAMMETSALSLALERATIFYNIAMVALIVGGIITIAATVALVWASSLKSRYADEHLVHALTQQEQAKAEAARANQRAAELLLRAQQARLDQEKTSLELEHVRAITGWRRINEEQHAKIVKALQGHPIAVNLLSPANDPEAAQFADDIVKTLKDAGLTVAAQTSMLPIPIRGIGMSMTSSTAGSALYAALRGADLEIKDLPERNPIMIVVGSKPSVTR